MVMPVSLRENVTARPVTPTTRPSQLSNLGTRYCSRSISLLTPRPSISASHATKDLESNVRHALIISPIGSFIAKFKKIFLPIAELAIASNSSSGKALSVAITARIFIFRSAPVPQPARYGICQVSIFADSAVKSHSRLPKCFDMSHEKGINQNART